MQVLNVLVTTQHRNNISAVCYFWHHLSSLLWPGLPEPPEAIVLASLYVVQRVLSGLLCSSSTVMCSCGETDSCGETGLRCFCDKNDNEWRSDEGYITNRPDLPVKEFCAGDTGDRLLLTVLPAAPRAGRQVKTTLVQNQYSPITKFHIRSLFCFLNLNLDSSSSFVSSSTSSSSSS